MTLPSKFQSLQEWGLDNPRGSQCFTALLLKVSFPMSLLLQTRPVVGLLTPRRAALQHVLYNFAIHFYTETWDLVEQAQLPVHLSLAMTASSALSSNSHLILVLYVLFINARFVCPSWSLIKLFRL